VAILREELVVDEVVRGKTGLPAADTLPRTLPELSTVAEPSPCTDTLPKTWPVAVMVASAAPPDWDAVELLLDSNVPSDRLMKRL
jgi:hypothetical protein